MGITKIKSTVCEDNRPEFTAMMRLNYLRSSGIVEGPSKISREDLAGWIKSCESDPDCCWLDDYAQLKLHDLELNNRG